MKHLLGILCVSLLGAPFALGAQTASPVSNELVEKLLARIDRLERRVADLESRLPKETAAPAPAPSEAAAQPAPEVAHHVPQPAVEIPGVPPSHPTLRIAGFSDFNFSATDLGSAPAGFGAQTLLRAHSGFDEGQFILHLSSALTSKVSVFGELSFTARADAGTGSPSAPGFNAEVERSIIQYAHNDYFKVSFGRYHTPINYWNTAFHHGQWLQTTISRPEMVQFGSSFIPVHFVGALVEGAVPAGGLNLNYNVGLGNGRGSVISRAGDFGDSNNNRAWLANLFVKPDRFYGLQVGGSVYRDEITLANGQNFREWIQSGHIVWTRETPEVLAEFANVQHSPVGSSFTSNSQAFYVQTAYRLPWFDKLWKPYYRFEYIHVPRADELFRVSVPSYDASTVGLRYDVSSFAALKFEYRHYRRPKLPSFNGAFMQTSFTF